MVSVALATYNGEKYILQQIQSIAEQTRPADEVIISDDASTDATADIVCKFIHDNELSNWSFIANKRNRGFNHNFFAALEHTHGDVVFLCDQDDVWLPEKIAVMAGLMEQHADWMLLSSSYDVIDGEGKKTDSHNVINAMQNEDKKLIEVTVDSQICCSFLRGCAMCLRREVIDAADQQNLSSILGHDWTLGMMASLLGKHFVLHQRLFHYRFHGNNTSLSAVSRKQLIGNTEERITALKKSVDAHTLILEKSSQYPRCTNENKRNIEKMIAFEKRRIDFLSNRRIYKWLLLVKYINSYKRYYKTMWGAWKVYIGDLLYAYRINFRVQ